MAAFQRTPFDYLFKHDKLGPRERCPVQRFWEYVDVTDCCWLWRGNINPRTGYGRHSHRRKNGKTGNTLAHRFSYTIHNGEIDSSEQVRHLCPCGPVRHCVNPHHMALGNHKDNAMDRVIHGTGATKHRRLTFNDVTKIRHMLARGEKIRAIADLFNCSYDSISAIRAGRTWVGGSESNSRKHTSSDVLRIDHLLREGVSITKIAENAGCSRATVRHIRDGKTWAWLTGRS